MDSYFDELFKEIEKKEKKAKKKDKKKKKKKKNKKKKKYYDEDDKYEYKSRSHEGIIDDLKYYKSKIEEGDAKSEREAKKRMKEGKASHYSKKRKKIRYEIANEMKHEGFFAKVKRALSGFGNLVRTIARWVLKVLKAILAFGLAILGLGGKTSREVENIYHEAEAKA